MVGVVIASHGRLADELLSSAEAIIGPLEGVATLCISCKTCESPTAKLTAAVDSVETGEGVLVLVDMFGGSPSQAACNLLHDRHVEVVSGVNLPMVIKIAQLRRDGCSLTELAHELQQYGQRSVMVASDLVRSYTAQASAGAEAPKGH